MEMGFYRIFLLFGGVSYPVSDEMTLLSCQVIPVNGTAPNLIRCPPVLWPTRDGCRQFRRGDRICLWGNGSWCAWPEPCSGMRRCWWWTRQRRMSVSAKKAWASVASTLDGRCGRWKQRRRYVESFRSFWLAWSMQQSVGSHFFFLEYTASPACLMGDIFVLSCIFLSFVFVLYFCLVFLSCVLSCYLYWYLSCSCVLFFVLCFVLLFLVLSWFALINLFLFCLVCLVYVQPSKFNCFVHFCIFRICLPFLFCSVR